MLSFQKRFDGFRSYPAAVIDWAWQAWRQKMLPLLLVSLFFGLSNVVVGCLLHGQALLIWPALEQIVGRPMSEFAVFIFYTVLSGAVVGFVAFLCLCFAAPSQIHLEQREHNATLLNASDERIVGLERDVEQSMLALADSRPKLLGSLDHLTTNDSPTPNDTLIILFASIINSGAQSIVDKFSLSVAIGDGPESTVQLVRFTNPFTVPGQRGMIQIPGEPLVPAPLKIVTWDDYLETMTAHMPIPRGSRVSGYVIGIAYGITHDKVLRPGTVLTLRFRDVAGQLYEAKQTITGNEPDPTKPLPGLPQLTS